MLIRTKWLLLAISKVDLIISRVHVLDTYKFILQDGEKHSKPIKVYCLRTQQNYLTPIFTSNFA